MTKFAWPAYPKSQAEFEALMSAIDSALVAQGLHPWQRQLHVPRKMWEAFGWSGNISPSKDLTSQPGFTGQILMAKAHAWYKHVYGERLKADMVYGYAPARLGNTVWRVRFGVIFGSVQLYIDRNLSNRGLQFGSPAASHYVLCAIEELTQGFAERLSDTDLHQYFQFHIQTHQALQGRHEFPCANALPSSARCEFRRSESSSNSSSFVACCRSCSSNWRTDRMKN